MACRSAHVAAVPERARHHRPGLRAGEAQQDSSLIFACGLMGFAAMVWVAIYQAMGIRFSSTVPFSYMVMSASRSRSARRHLPRAQCTATSRCSASSRRCLFLFVPFIMQWSIGSYVSSSGVMLWALLAPVGRHDLPGRARVAAVVLRLHRADRGVRVLRLLPHRGRRGGRDDAEHRGVLRAQLRRDVHHRLPPHQLLRAPARQARGADQRAARAAEGGAGEVRAAAAQHPARPDRAAAEAAAQHHRRRLRRRDRDVRRHHQLHAALGGDVAAPDGGAC